MGVLVSPPKNPGFWEGLSKPGFERLWNLNVVGLWMKDSEPSSNLESEPLI